MARSIPVAYFSLQNEPVVVFDIDAWERTDRARSHLLDDLMRRMRLEGLPAVWGALRFFEGERCVYFGSEGLTHHLRKHHIHAWTHTLTVQFASRFLPSPYCHELRARVGSRILAGLG